MNKVALVTGAGSGIGRATALAFAKDGARTIVADIAEQAGRETVDLIREAGGEAAFVQVDVGSSSSVENMVNRAVELYGRLDYAFNNAGIASKVPVAAADLAESHWDQMINVNLKGVWLCIKYECRQMLKQGSGAIVNTSSIMGVVSSPTGSSYSASKFGVIGLTKAAALDYATLGIRVNAVCPGGIETPMTADPALTELMARATPMARMGKADEIAKTVLWLCSEQASYVTGQAICVDGGFTVW